VSIWTTLGLARTDDAAEIRRAYARALKAIDVETDPDAFIALREAFQGALQHAESRRRRMEESVGEDFLPGGASGLLDPVPFEQQIAPPPPPASPPPEALPSEPQAPQDDGARFVALEALLFPEDGAANGYPSAPDPDALVEAVRAILDHPAMAAIDVSADVENWLAGILYDAGSRSDAVLAIVVDRFAWEKNAGRWDNHWLFEELVRRRNALAWIGRVAEPGHPHHDAWRDLTSDKERLGFGVAFRRKQVRDLLETIRRDFPAAEATLSPRRVALWDDQLYPGGDPDAGGYTGTTLGWGMLVFWGVLLLFRLGSSLGPGTSSSPPPPSFVTAPRAVTTPAADLDPVISRASQGELDLAALAAGNPVLHERRMNRWRRQRDTPVPGYEFDEDIRTLLREGEREALRGGSYALQSAYWRLLADELIWLKARNVQQCEQAVGGGYLNMTLPLEFTGRRERIRAQALGEPLPAAASPPAADHGRFIIPAAAVAIAMQRSGLSQDVLHEAWQNRGTVAQRCGAGIALIEAALALPRREGRRLLRDMSAGL
jgi:hypothetical protein